MTKALTIVALKAVKGGPARREIPDGALPGLYLVVQPSGAMSWALRFRFEGKPKKLTIGPVIVSRDEALDCDPLFGQAMTLPEARAAARKALQALAEGRDPSDTKKDQAIAAVAARKDDKDFLVQVMAASFIERYAKPKNRSWKETERQFSKEISGYEPKDGEEYNRRPWEGRDVRLIQKSDVVKLLDGIVDRGSPITANRVFATLNVFFNWLVGRDILDTNPMLGMKKISIESSRDRVLSDDEVRIFWQATAGVEYPFGPMWRLLLLTAQRRAEVAGLEWKELSLAKDAPHWVLPRARSKNGRENFIPLTPKAFEIITGVTRVEKATHVLTTTGDTAVSGFSRSKRRLDKLMLAIMEKEAAADGRDPKGVSLQQWGLHDLRRTAATGMARLGQPIHVVEAILNHSGGTISGVAAVYQRHDFAEEKRAALKAWETFVLSLAGETGSNVIPMRA